MSKTDLPFWGEEEQTIEIGVVGRPHGVRGAFRFFPFNPTSDLFNYLESVVVRPIDSPEKVLRILDLKPGSKSMVMELEGVTSRRLAEVYKGASILIPRNQLPEVDDGEFYIADLLGIVAWSDGKQLGKVVSSREQGGVEVITVSDGAQDIEIPLVDRYVVALSVEEGRLEVRDVDDMPRSATRKKGLKRGV